MADSLREMVYSASECLDLPVTEAVEDLVKAIGHISLQVASLIDEYIRLPSAGKPSIMFNSCLISYNDECFKVRGLRDTLSDDIKERAGLLQTRCRDVTEKFAWRMNINVNLTLQTPYGTTAPLRL